MKVYCSLFTLVSVFCLNCDLARGHHAISATYDEDAIGTIQGVVVEVFWANPHVHYYLEVINDAEVTELWDIETGNLIGLSRSGWTKETIEVGDYIKVSGNLGREGTRRLNLDRDTLAVLNGNLENFNYGSGTGPFSNEPTNSANVQSVDASAVLSVDD